MLGLRLESSGQDAPWRPIHNGEHSCGLYLLTQAWVVKSGPSRALFHTPLPSSRKDSFGFHFQTQAYVGHSGCYTVLIHTGFMPFHGREPWAQSLESGLSLQVRMLLGVWSALTWPTHWQGETQIRWEKSLTETTVASLPHSVFFFPIFLLIPANTIW